MPAVTFDKEVHPRRPAAVLSIEGLDVLIRVLRDHGYRVVGPTVHDGAIVFDEIEGIGELPVGWTDVQEGGRYRLRHRDDRALFGYAVGPHSWKQFLFPSRTRLWRAAGDPDVGFTLEAGPDESPRYVFLGARSCDLHAIGIQDKVFLAPDVTDPTYAVLGGPAPSSSRSTAGWLGARASAYRWAPGRGLRRTSTWRSPSSSTTGDTSSSLTWGARRAQQYSPRLRCVTR